jgi:integrase
MALIKRGEIWWVDIFQQGTRIRKTTGTSVKKLAQEFHDGLKHDLWKAKYLKQLPKKRWIDAVIRWLEESQHKRSLEADKRHLKWLDPFLRGLLLSDIDAALIESIAKQKEQTGVRPATVNRVLEILRAILNRAKNEWEWIDSVPHIRMRKTENKRIRWLTKKQSTRLLNELPEHLCHMAEFSLSTGLRASNVTKLKWDAVDLKRKHAFISAHSSKTKKAIAVPLSQMAIEILEAQKGKHKEYVFTYHGRPVTRCSNHAWRKALKRAGIENFRWHDLRHTWASWHIQSGTSLYELQLLGGWSNYETVLRYAHLSSQHLKEACERINDTKMTQ